MCEGEIPAPGAPPHVRERETYRPASGMIQYVQKHTLDVVDVFGPDSVHNFSKMVSQPIPNKSC